jgi:formylglycine-generating enzyme required for sulfatase activity
MPGLEAPRSPDGRSPIGGVALVLAVCIGVFGGCPAPVPRPVDDMVKVEAGAFFQGIDEAELAAIVELCRAHAADGECDAASIVEHHRSETPRRRVELPAFEIDRTEVTRAAHAACVAAGGCTPIRPSACVRVGDDPVESPARGDAVLDALPVVCVSPAQAAEHCAWLGKRLPTEAEWEKAARGPDGRRFPWGDAWDPLALGWGDDGEVDGFVGAAPVGSYPRGASPYGALDMAGNVWEWVAGADEEGRPLMRGGGYAALPIAMRTTKRVPRPPKGHENVGFRCAR